jgi:chitinase
MLALAALGAAAQKSPREFAVVGYVFPRGSLLAPGQIDAHNLTRINYAFAAIEDGRLAAGSPLNAPNPGAPNPDAQNLDAQNLALLTSLRKQNPSLTVLVSVGGWLGSGAFSDVALSAQSRKVFVESAVDFLRRYDLDGLDVDWEYPGMPGSGHTFRPEDKRDFTLLLKDLRSRFDREEKATGRSLILTIAAAAFSDYLAHTEMKDVQRYADTVNLMTYDYAMPSVDAITSHNAPLFADPAAPSQLSADASIRAFELAGVPSRKILLGVPFFGRPWGQVADRNHGLFQPGKPAPGDFAPYSTIQQTMLGHGFTRYWDDTASVPYLYSADRQEFVSYEDAESLAVKCAYIKTHKLGGAMFWQYLDDPSGALVETMARALGPSPGTSQ